MKIINGWGSVAVASVAALHAIARGPVKVARDEGTNLDRPARYGIFAAQTEAVGNDTKAVKRVGVGSQREGASPKPAVNLLSIRPAVERSRAIKNIFMRFKNIFNWQSEPLSLRS